MMHHSLKLTVRVACILLISSELAEANITKYVDADGITTYTNSIQENGNPDAPIPPPNRFPEVNKIVAAETGVPLLTNKLNSEDWVVKRANVRSVALDVETIKAARLAMLAKDHASHALRHKEIIAYDQRNQGWFDFH